jgi:hypothetical protein
VARAEPVEEAPSVAEKNWNKRDFEHIEYSRAQEFLRRVCPVQHDITITGGPLGLIDARLHALGDETDIARLCLGGDSVRDDEYRHPVVMIAVPVVGEVGGAPAGDHCAGRRHLVENRLARLVARPIAAGIVTVALRQPLMQSVTPVAKGVALGVLRARDEAIERHRHVQHDA